MAALPEPERSAALIAAWTRMEARFKASPGPAGGATVRTLDAGLRLVGGGRRHR